MIDKDTIVDDAQTVYCPECDEDYKLQWSAHKNKMFVVCGCYEAENVYSFLQRFADEHAKGTSTTPDDQGMYQ